MKLLNKLHEFITEPSYTDDDTFGAVAAAMFVASIAGWIIIGCNVSWLVWWIPIVSFALAICCLVTWYYIDESNITMHYVYVLLALLFSGAFVIVFPIALFFCFITLPLWITSAVTNVISFFKE